MFAPTISPPLRTDSLGFADLLDADPAVLADRWAALADTVDRHVPADHVTALRQAARDVRHGPAPVGHDGAVVGTAAVEPPDISLDPANTPVQACTGPSFLPVFPSRSSFRLWRNLVSAVDQQAWLAAGRVRRLLLRLLLVLGGAFALSAIGWLLCAGTANAGELPAVPSVPSVVAGVDDTVAQVSIQDVPAPELPSTPLPDTGLSKVTQQVHLPTAAVDDKIVPAVAPVVTPLVSSDTKPVRPAAPVAQSMSRPAAPVAPVRFVTAEPVAHKHVTGQARGRSTSRGTAQVPSRSRSHAPVLPPLQPAGSSDANAHDGGGVAGGPGGPQVPVQHVLGNGLDLAGPPSTPRLAVVPGQQPGTSPD